MRTHSRRGGSTSSSSIGELALALALALTDSRSCSRSYSLVAICRGQQSNPTLEPPGFDTPPLWHGKAFSWWQDQTRNTWACLRQPPMQSRTADGDAGAASKDTIFCQWFDSWDDKEAGKVAFEEYYDIGADPYQLNNSVHPLSNESLATLRSQLTALRNCKGGAACNTLTGG